MKPEFIILNIRITGNNSGGKILFRVDGQNVTGFIDVPVTGGWNSWRTISDTSNIELTAGKHTLQMNFYFGGFNVNSFDLTKTIVSVEDKKEVIKSFKVYQNYPNPFNPSTTIKFSIPTDEFVSLSIYNIIGEKVASLLNGKISSGIHEINFNAINLSSGTYIYKLQAGSFTSTRKMIVIK